jgi:hypothetical protein
MHKGYYNELMLRHCAVLDLDVATEHKSSPSVP